MTKQELINSDHYELSEKVMIADAATWMMTVLGFSSKKEPNKSSFLKSTLISVAIGVAFAIIGFKVGSLIAKNGTNESSSDQMLWAIFLFFPIIVIHEVIHALTYKYFGAPKVGFGFSLKSMMVYAYAQEHPTNMHALKWVAIMPFLVITTAFLLALFFLPQYRFLSLFTLLIHTFCCVGDFALVKYANKNPRNITYDDIDNEKAMYFFKPKGK